MIGQDWPLFIQLKFPSFTLFHFKFEFSPNHFISVLKFSSILNLISKNMAKCLLFTVYIVFCWLSLYQCDSKDSNGNDDQLILYSTGSCFKFYRLLDHHRLDKRFASTELSIDGPMSCHSSDRSIISAFDYLSVSVDQFELYWANSSDRTVRQARLRVNRLDHHHLNVSITHHRKLTQFDHDYSKRFLIRGLVVLAQQNLVLVVHPLVGQIESINITSGSRSLLHSNLTRPSQLIADPQSNHLVWLQGGNSIWCSNIITTESPRLLYESKSSNHLVMARDAHSRRLFIMNSTGSIVSLDLDDFTRPLTLETIINLKSNSISRPHRLVSLPSLTNRSFLLSDLNKGSRLFHVEFESNHRIDSHSTRPIRPNFLLLDSQIYDVFVMSLSRKPSETTTPVAISSKSISATTWMVTTSDMIQKPITSSSISSTIFKLERDLVTSNIFVPPSSTNPGDPGKSISHFKSLSFSILTFTILLAITLIVLFIVIWLFNSCTLPTLTRVKSRFLLKDSKDGHLIQIDTNEC